MQSNENFFSVDIQMIFIDAKLQLRLDSIVITNQA